MADYIEREALLKEIQEEIDFESAMYTEEQNKWFAIGLKCAYRDVKSQPIADVVSRAEARFKNAEITLLEDEIKRLGVENKQLKAEVERLNIELDALIKNYAGCMKEYVMEIFEEIESVLFTVANPCPSADGTIIVKHSKDFYLRREDYYTIKEKYTKGGVEE